MKKHPTSKSNLINILWDAFCCLSIIGIWPRFIEPNLLATTRLKLQIPNLPAPLHGFKIVQFTDLHLNPNVPDAFLAKLQRKIQALNPDVIVFTGDFLCFSLLDEKERLQKFLSGFHAPYGCYAIYGNHDYASFVSVSPEGDYDLLSTTPSNLWRGLKRILRKTSLTGKVTSRTQQIPLHPDLGSLLQKTPFVLLDNASRQIKVGNTILNICGVGEHMLGRCDPKQAFEHYDPHYPGIILAHNPDCISVLKDYPGDIILSGHTHGGQINLPWVWRKVTLMENIDLARGLAFKEHKKVYTSRGVGSVMPFRWFSVPEILELTLEQDHAT